MSFESLEHPIFKSDYVYPPNSWDVEACFSCGEVSKSLSYFNEMLLCPYDLEQEQLKQPASDSPSEAGSSLLKEVV